MVFIPGLVGLLLVLTADARVGPSSEQPELCTETRECLLYDVVCKTATYEVRHYSAVKWVSTDEAGFLMEAPLVRAFRRLFKYIDGGNEQGAKVEMTSPVVLKEDQAGTWASNVYTMSFLLPSEHQQKAPTPTDAQVYFTDMPEMKVYVRSYGGWMGSWWTWINTYYLKRDLKAAGAQYDGAFAYGVGYDSPMKMLNRHNEVWFPVVGEPVC